MVKANYWNEHTVQLAMSRAQSQRVQQALNEDEEHIAFESLNISNVFESPLVLVGFLIPSCDK